MLIENMIYLVKKMLYFQICWFWDSHRYQNLLILASHWNYIRIKVVDAEPLSRLQSLNMEPRYYLFWSTGKYQCVVESRSSLFILSSMSSISGKQTWKLQDWSYSSKMNWIQESGLLHLGQYSRLKLTRNFRQYGLGAYKTSLNEYC